MTKFLYFAGFTFIALSGSAVVRALRAPPPGDYAVGPVPVAPAQPPAPTGSSAEQWFASIKQYCNPVEVDVRTRYEPAPSTPEGQGYAAACFALAGKIAHARTIMMGIDAGNRSTAANIVFNVAHPVADAGDDRASGEMMELVLAFWPNNYMALYHAGMSAYTIGNDAVADRHLRGFLSMYDASDGFTKNARDALSKMASRSGSQATRPIVEREPARP
jgi:hypothetical protein